MRTTPADSPALVRLRALAELAELVGAATRESDLVEQVVEWAAHLVGDAAMVWRLPTGEDGLVCVAATHPDPAGRELLAEIRSAIPDTDSGPIRSVVTTGTPLVMDGFDAGELAGAQQYGYAQWTRRFGISSAAVLPMRARGRVVGALAMSRDAGNDPYSDDDVLFMQALADVTAAGLDIARLLTDSAAALDELRRQSELVDHVSDAVIVLDADQRVVSWNTAAERIYGYTPGDVLGGDLFALLATECFSVDADPEDRDEVIAQTLRGGWTGELRERNADGGTVQTLASFSALPGSSGGTGGIVVVNRDVTEQRHKEHLATHDALTSLPNRRMLADCLRRAMDHAARTKSSMAVVFLDLNGFKGVNDRLGHEAGDEVLRVTASRLGELVRSSDVVGRLGGDEFVVVATNVEMDGAELLGRRLLAGLSVPIALDGEAVVVPPSIGIALSAGGEEPEEVLRAADGAMYAAKQQRSGVAFARPEVLADVSPELSAELRDCTVSS